MTAEIHGAMLAAHIALENAIELYDGSTGVIWNDQRARVEAELSECVVKAAIALHELRKSHV